MRIRIAYQTSYKYDAPAKTVTQILRMTPRDHDGQHVINWRIEPDPDARLRPGEDFLGNVTHTMFYTEPLDRLTITVTGEVDTTDTTGIVRGAPERFPAEVFLRDTALTHADPALRQFALEATGAGGGDRLAALHALMGALHAEVAFDTDATEVTGTAAEAFAQRRGVCQDISHIFVGAARAVGFPARYVSGHLMRDGGPVDQNAAHAWAEVFVEDLGWVGFDPTNDTCPTEAYVRVAAGFDYLGASPVRGARYGGGAEHLTVRLRVEAAQQQNQS